jgi:hypothetical protein
MSSLSSSDLCDSSCLPAGNMCPISGSFWAGNTGCPRGPVNSACIVPGGGGNGFCTSSGVCTACPGGVCPYQLASVSTGSSATCAWVLGSATPCSQTCGGGMQRRTALCSCSDGSFDETGDRCSGSSPPGSLSRFIF